MTFTCAPVGGRVLVVLLAILVPVVANATCGWFLLMPTTLTPDERNDRDWRQSSAFDFGAGVSGHDHDGNPCS